MSKAVDDLRHQLGAEPPTSITNLKEADIAHLAGALQAARHHQTVALEESTESGLNFLPRLVRGPVKKVLFG